MSIGEKLKKMRELRNLTQKELAEMSGIAFSQISKIELGNIQDPGRCMKCFIFKTKDRALSVILVRFRHKKRGALRPVR